MNVGFGVSASLFQARDASNSWPLPIDGLGYAAAAAWVQRTSTDWNVHRKCLGEVFLESEKPELGSILCYTILYYIMLY